MEDLNKAEIELRFLEELAGVGDFKRFSTLTGIKIGPLESIDLADVTVMKIGGVKDNLKVLDENLSRQDVLDMFHPYDKSLDEFVTGDAEENDSRALCANIYGVIGIKKLVVPCGPPTIKIILIIQHPERFYFDFDGLCFRITFSHYKTMTREEPSRVCNVLFPLSRIGVTVKSDSEREGSD